MISDQQATKAVRKVFPKSTVIKTSKIRGGIINENYIIKINNPNRELVLKIYPKEGWKAEKEKYLYNLISNKINIPVPTVHSLDTSKKIFPKNYLLLSKLVGEEMTPPNSAVVCKIPTSDELIRESGSLLAKIHSIKFSSYGWIIRSKISPKFSTWSDFVFFDLGEKINKLSKTPKIKESFIEKSLNYIEERKHLLNINSEPCLLHKDYHCSHIFANSKKITGIIDFEWSIAGHNELDLVKSLWWMFEDSKEHEKTFLKGYHKFGSISKKFEKRKKLYRLYLLIGLIGLSIEKKNKKWFDYNLKEAKEILK